MTTRVQSSPRDVVRFRAEVDVWARRLNVQPSGVYLRPMTKKWASCSAGGLVSFNTKLLAEERGFRETVIVHELLHLRIPNHGRLFKSLMRAYLPSASVSLSSAEN
jgi:predicted metal-dependent hydrolase